jgi:arginyl-tRNA synthetase
LKKSYKNINIEFVSANPTGPIHVGHGRGAVLGDSLANILKFCGYNVAKEYYINDAGRQIDILTISVLLRTLNKFDSNIKFPESAYQGDYIFTLVDTIGGSHLKQLKDLTKSDMTPKVENDDNEKILDFYINFFKKNFEGYSNLQNQFLNFQVNECKKDLQSLGINYDHWFSEKQLHENKQIDRVIQKLDKAGHLISKDNALWFDSKKFGDDKLRVIVRDNGDKTYFASDLAYHEIKLQKYDQSINIWGADHHGYIKRVINGIKALKLDEKKLEIILVQFANLKKNNEVLPMSTRKGEFFKLTDLVKEVGVDATRLFYLLRKSDQHMDFDIDLAKDNTKDNPVYYVQYAYARCRNLIKKSKFNSYTSADNNFDLLNLEQELLILDKLDEFPDIIKTVSLKFTPHILVDYLRSLSKLFHNYYASVQIISQDVYLSNTRLSLVYGVSLTIKNGLNLLGISSPENM